VRLPIEAVKVAGERRACDEKKVRELANSIAMLGQLVPIIVRRMEQAEDRASEAAAERVELVAGRNRLEAVRALDLPYIDAIVVEADDDEAQLQQIAENLHRAELTVAEISDQTAEWARLIEQKRSILGQVDQQSRRGRPVGGIAEAARQLPVPGKTEEARRKALERAIKIAGTSPEARSALKAAGLDDNQSALLQVAAEPTPARQVGKVSEIVDRKRAAKRKKRTHKKRKKRTHKKSIELPDGAAHAPSPDAAAPDVEIDESGPATNRPEQVAESDPHLEALRAAWDAAADFRAAWARAPQAIKDQFIDAVLRAPANPSNEQ
jgi:ParB family chromosome partitioning protein